MLGVGLDGVAGLTRDRPGRADHHPDARRPRQSEPGRAGLNRPRTSCDAVISPPHTKRRSAGPSSTAGRSSIGYCDGGGESFMI
jgi:hypothetical protein